MKIDRRGENKTILIVRTLDVPVYFTPANRRYNGSRQTCSVEIPAGLQSLMSGSHRINQLETMLHPDCRVRRVCSEVLLLILKVLNGPLFGAEFALPGEECFIRVVDLDVQAVYPEIENALDASTSHAVLTIPLAGPSPNFTLKPMRLEDESETLRLTVFDDGEGMLERDVELNVPLSVGELRIAVRRADDLWSEAVLQDRREVVRVAEVVPQEATSQVQPEIGWRERVGTLVGAALGGVGVLVAMWSLWPAAAPAQSVTRLLAGAPGNVMEDAHGDIHVIAHHDEGAGAIRRTLQKAGGEAQVHVATRAQESARIEKFLDEESIRYFAVRMNDPKRPSLMLMDPLPDEARRRLGQIIVYAQDFEIQVRGEEEAQLAARHLIRNLGFNASESVAPGRFVVSIDDHLADTQLDALGRAVQVFQTKWGERYVNFVIKQRDLVTIDGVKTGDFGYELRGLRHLFFEKRVGEGA